MSSGEYCIFMNSGDSFYDCKVLETSMEYLDSDTSIIVGSAVVGGFLYNAPEEKELSLSFFIKGKFMSSRCFLLKRHYCCKFHIMKVGKLQGTLNSLQMH